MSKLALIGNVRMRKGSNEKGERRDITPNNTSNVNESVSAIVTHRPDRMNSTH